MWANDEPWRVPPTLTFQYRRTYALYGCDVKGYLGKTENMRAVTPDDLLEQFTEPIHENGHIRGKGRRPSGILAYYVYSKEIDGQVKPQVEYFDEPALEEFLLYRSKENNGILQRFVEPQGAENAVVRAWWTPHLCKLETRANRSKIDATNKPIAARAVTFDGTEDVTTVVPLMRRTEQRINKLMNRVSNAIHGFLPTDVRIQLLVLYLKVIGNNIVIMWCGSLKLTDSSGSPMAPLSTDGMFSRPATAKISETVRPKKVGMIRGGQPSGSTVESRNGDLLTACVACRCWLKKGIKSRPSYPIEYKAVMSHFLFHGVVKGNEMLNNTYQHSGAEKGTATLLRKFLGPDPTFSPFAFEENEVLARTHTEYRDAMSAWNVAVVDILHRADEAVTADRLRALKDTEEFQRRTLKVCEGCCLAFNNTSISRLGDGRFVPTSARKSSSGRSARRGQNYFEEVLLPRLNAPKAAEPRSPRHKVPQPGRAIRPGCIGDYMKASRRRPQPVVIDASNLDPLRLPLLSLRRTTVQARKSDAYWSVTSVASVENVAKRLSKGLFSAWRTKGDSENDEDEIRSLSELQPVDSKASMPSSSWENLWDRVETLDTQNWEESEDSSRDQTPRNTVKLLQQRQSSVSETWGSPE